MLTGFPVSSMRHKVNLLRNVLSVDVSQAKREVIVWKFGRTAVGESHPFR